MQELVKVAENENQEQLVSARELHEFLESRQDFTDWIKNRIEKYGFIENLDFTIILGKSTGGRPSKDYILKLDTAKEIAMVEGNEKGKQARRYFIQCEKDLKNKNKVPTNYLESLKQLVISEERRIEAERKNAILMHINKNYTMTEIAKELGMKSAIELNAALSDKKVQYKVNGTWVLYSKYSNLGYEDIKQDILDNGKVVYHRKITQLGREFILNLFNN